MDCNGNHDLKSEFLKEIFQKIQKEIGCSDNIKIATEESPDADKRFDISVKINDNYIVVFEVKCKTMGTKKQLERYSEKANLVIRIGFDEWNFPDLNDDDRKKYPLIKYSEINDILKRCESFQKSQYFKFLDDFGNQLANESNYFQALKDYYIDEKADAKFPDFPNFHRYSQRFYNILYWEWFGERLKREKLFDNLLKEPPETKSERSGVWFAMFAKDIDSQQTKKFGSLNLELPGKFGYWVHIELANKTGIIANSGIIGSIQLKIHSEEDRHGIYRLISSQNSCLGTHKFTVTGKTPSKNSGYYSALTRQLSAEEFRYSKLVEIINLLI